MTFNANEIRRKMLVSNMESKQKFELENSEEFLFQAAVQQIEQRIPEAAAWGGGGVRFRIEDNEKWYVLREGCPRWDRRQFVFAPTFCGMFYRRVPGIAPSIFHGYYGDESNLSHLGKRVIRTFRERGFDVELRTPWSDGHDGYGEDDVFCFLISW